MTAYSQEKGPNSGETSEDGVLMRPNVSNEEAMQPDYIQQSLVPLDSETHSGVGELLKNRRCRQRKWDNLWMLPFLRVTGRALI